MKPTKGSEEKRNGFLNQTSWLSKIRTKMLSKEKNLANPWYLLCFMDINHENSMIMIVPIINLYSSYRYKN